MKNRQSTRKEFFESVTDWQRTFDAIPDIILVVDNNHKILMANRALSLKLDIDRDALLGKHCYEIIHNLKSAPLYCPCIQSDLTETGQMAEAYEKHLDSHYSFTASPFFNSAGERIGTVDIIRDISALTLTKEALTDSENIFHAITESATDAIVSIDRDDNIVLWNRTAKKMFGYSAEEAIGNKLTIIMPPQYKQAHRKGVSRFISTRKSNMIGKNYEVTALRKDGTEFPVELSLSSWERKNNIFFTAIIRDATRRKKLEQQLRDASLTDELTGLLNRRGFMTLSEKQMEISKRYKRIFAILFLDLNEMKQINDAYGHKAGDQALVELAGLLKKTFRSSDIIARIGGDEFTVLINEPRSDFEKTVTENIVHSLQKINDKSDRPYTLSASLGISYFNPSRPQSIDALLAEADKRMYEHKGLKFDEIHSASSLQQKRKSERISIGHTCVAELIVSDNSMIRNISSDGICLTTPHMLKKDNMYSVKIHSHESEPVTLSAVVVWSSSMKKVPVNSSDCFETGMMFTDLDTVRKHTLETLIKSLPG